MNDHSFVVPVGFFVLGVIAGGLGRRWLARLRRGAVFRPPVCELVAGLLSAVLGLRLATGALPSWWVAVPLLLGWLAVPLAAADLVVQRLPDALTGVAYPLLGCALLGAALGGPDHGLAWRALAGAVLFGGVHLAVRCCAPGALGGGDVKLAGSLGAVLGALGWGALLLATVLASVITIALALSPLPRAVGAWSSPLRRGAPHGPGLLAATWLVAAFPGGALPVPR